ncbi:MAG: 1-acyl-sn-glycerol-3-phosphate acyltransferase [Clostridia bacterium]|nr:1-acyl-sn-glycerol-3-phosphate acyltransferase [Clostridia bacterium]
MEDKKIIYYEDELNDEFSEAKITPRRIDENYKYFHKNPFWNFCSFMMQNFVSMPIKYFDLKLKFKHKYIGKEKFKQCKKTGYFIYANHTQAFEDTFIPSVANYPKRNFLIVNPANVSMKGMKTLVEWLGAIPIPDTKEAMKKFLDIINYRINKKCSITIYPEAHIWPYYTKIRPFKSVSFKYPVKLNVPVFCITNTYQKRKNGKVKIVSYVDGPFYKKENLNLKEAQEDLRNTIYDQMVERSKNNNIEVIKYIKK